MDLWNIIQIDPHKPTKRNQDGVDINKPKEEWTVGEKARDLLNSRAKFFLLCALSRTEYDRI